MSKGIEMPERKNPNCLENINSIYIHVPFCHAKCGYCDYYSLNTSLANYAAYYQGIAEELAETTAYCREQNIAIDPLKTLYFGGGTPSVLPPQILQKIIFLCRDSFGFNENIEITLEVNPEPISKATVLAGIAAGVNRISLGFQAKQDELLQRIGRRHSYQDFLSTLKYIQQAGVNNISCDLMFGLPGQTLTDVEQSALDLIRLQIPHISFYSLILEEHTLFYKRYHEHPERLPSEDLERRMYARLLQMFSAADYEYYELSSTAKPGYYSRHNYNYWTTKPYLGFGPGAHGYFAGVRKGNIRSLKKWLSDPFHSAEFETIDFDLAMREYAMLTFRLSSGFSISEFEKRFALQNPFQNELEKLLHKGLIYFNKQKQAYVLTEKGLDFANEVFIEFI